MFGSKNRKIERLQDELDKATMQLKLEFTNSSAVGAKLQESERSRIEAIAQLENLREQLLRANEVRDVASAELQKRTEELAHAQEELRMAQEAAARTARADSWGGAPEDVLDIPEYPTDEKSSAS